MIKSDYGTNKHTTEQNNHHSNQGNPNNLAYHSSRGGKK